MNKLSTILLLSLFLSFTSVSAEVSPESLVNIFQRLEALEKKVRELHGANEVLTHQLNQLKKAQKEGFLSIDERIDGLSAPKQVNSKAKETTLEEKSVVKIIDYKPSSNIDKSDAANLKDKQEKKLKEVTSLPESETKTINQSEPVKKEDKKVVDEKPKTKKNRPPSAYEKETYQLAFNLMKTSPSAATKAFRDYIKLQPNSPLAANSQYWIAEIMYSHNNYKGAVQEFIKVLQQYKYSDKAPDAAIKLGYSFYALKNWAYARRTFEDVLKYFPKNKNAVTLAKKRLEKLKAAGN